MAEDFKLFKDDGSDVALPSSELSKKDEEKEKLKSISIDKAILGESVKTILIPESFDIETPNYVLDFRECDKVTDFQLRALASVIRERGGTKIYIIVKNGMQCIGNGDTDTLNDILALGISKIFGSKCKLYRDVEKGKPAKRVILGDSSSIRLNL